jgi:hypothetical protein
MQLFPELLSVRFLLLWPRNSHPNTKKIFICQISWKKEEWKIKSKERLLVFFFNCLLTRFTDRCFFRFGQRRWQRLQLLFASFLGWKQELCFYLKASLIEIQEKRKKEDKFH